MSVTVPDKGSEKSYIIFSGNFSDVDNYDGSSLSTISGSTLNALITSIDTKIGANKSTLENLDSGNVEHDATGFNFLTVGASDEALSGIIDDIDSKLNSFEDASVAVDASGYSFLATASATVEAVLSDIDAKLAALDGGDVSIADGGFSTISGSTAQAAIASADGKIDTLETDNTTNKSNITALQNADQTETNTITTSGGTLTLDPASNKKFQYIDGTATITSSYTVSTGGSPSNGDEFWAFYDAAITPTASENVTIFGETLSDAEMLSAKILFITKYDGSSWHTIKFVDSDYITSTVEQNNTVVSKSSAYTASANEFVKVDASGGAVTITLPAASLVGGKEITVIKTDATGNAVTIDGDGSETINGSTTESFTSQYDSRVVVSDGSNWLIK